MAIQAMKIAAEYTLNFVIILCNLSDIIYMWLIKYNGSWKKWMMHFFSKKKESAKYYTIVHTLKNVQQSQFMY